MKRSTVLVVARAVRGRGAQPWHTNNCICLPRFSAAASSQSFHSISIPVTTGNRHPPNTSSRYPRQFLTHLKAKERTYCFYSSDTTTNGDDNHDPYDRYRSHVMTDEVWQEIQAENEQTRRGAIPDVALYDQVLEEMIQAAQRIPPPPPELGPTGKYAYSFQDVGDRRIYRRQPSSTVKSGLYQTVTDLHVDDQLLAMSLSVDESMVAYLLETATSNPSSHTGNQKPDGSRGKQVAVVVRHIDSGVTTELILPTNGCGISSLEFGPIQSNGLHSLFYVTNDHKGRPFAVWACNIEAAVDGIKTNPVKLQPSDKHKPVLLKEFLNPAIMVNVQRTKGCQYVAIQASTKTGNEIYLCRDVLTSTTEDPNMTLVMPHQDGVVYHLDIGHEEDVYILISTNDASIAGQDDTIILREGQCSSPSQGPEFSLWHTKIEALPLAQPNAMLDSSSSTFISGAQQGHVITDMDIFKDFIALYERSTDDGTQRIRLVRTATTHTGAFREQIMAGQEKIVPVGSASEHEFTSLSPSGNLHYNADSVRFAVESPACPRLVYEYSAKTDQLMVLSAESEFRTESLHLERVMVESEDGTLVPLSLVYREQPSSKKPKRAILVGYGSYGEPLELSYDPAMQPLLKRGFVLAYAHTRGGGDLGKAWYHRGRLYAKQKAVEDYVACAKALSKSHQITAKAFSAGGVIVGAAVNQNPELFANVVLTNCFLDVKKTMGNPNLFLTDHEIDEFGDPTNDKKAAEAISAYCPVSTANQAKEQNSRFLIIGAFDDMQTPFWNALIYGRLMRKRSRAKNRVFIHIESHGGHHLQLHVAAMEGAFVVGNRASYFGIEIDH